ncbi:MAG: leucine-rich repeat domain-containing protein [Promethearchaeota archaeon]
MQNEGTELVSFRGAKIHKFEADILGELESFTGKKFKPVNKIEQNTEMGFTVINNFVTGIDLHNCGLRTLPEAIGNLKSLVNLDLRWNQLTTLPESIGKLKSLQKLDLSYNQLMTLLESIGDLSSLKELYLRSNQLRALPGSILNLSSLNTLYLKPNPLCEDLDPKTLSILRELKGRGVDIDIDIDI